MMRIESNQPTKRNNAQLMLATATGAALGAGSRFIIPSKGEFSALKNSADSFFSTAATSARGANRSILKYAGAGAIIAAGIHGLVKAFTKKPEKETYTDTFEYSKYAAIIDAPEYACEILLYED